MFKNKDEKPAKKVEKVEKNDEIVKSAPKPVRYSIVIKGIDHNKKVLSSNTFDVRDRKKIKEIKAIINKK